MSTRFIGDAALKITRAMPAQNSNVDSTAIDLEQVAGGATVEAFELELAVPALPSLADAQTMTFTLQDSANNSAFAAIPELATLVRTGASGAGAAAVTRKVRLPSSVRRYVRMNIAASSTAGNNTAVSATLRPVF